MLHGAHLSGPFGIILRGAAAAATIPGTVRASDGAAPLVRRRRRGCARHRYGSRCRAALVPGPLLQEG